MKHIITRGVLSLTLIGWAGAAIGQFPVVNTHPDRIAPIGSLSGGWRYIGEINYGSGTRTIYDLGMSIYRVLNFLAPPTDMVWMNMAYITEDLFDTDPSNIEFMMQAYGPGGTSPAIFIYREDGTQLFSQDPANYAVTSTANSAYGPIYTVDNITYMALSQTISGGPTTIYELPGQLPCMDCKGSPQGSGMTVGEVDHNFLPPTVALFPNPAQT